MLYHHELNTNLIALGQGLYLYYLNCPEVYVTKVVIFLTAFCKNPPCLFANVIEGGGAAAITCSRQQLAAVLVSRLNPWLSCS